ncbi:AbrB/MazE/SpoVT family DNA-binding domain-containing protein [Pricia sp.]|uniref:AbrB/MazE/SpoVT family DNA-binding domain-containing protein n=1 Tax=Pricia sp. TaxID=2268138 RepID=UPI003593C8FF
MEVNIIKVGNSKGIIIPAQFMKLIGLKSKVNIQIENDKLVIAPAKDEARKGWEEIILKEISENGQSESLVPDFFEDENSEDWTW